MGRDIFFVEKRLNCAEQTIIIFTTGYASKDLEALVDRILFGDTPPSRELVAIMDNIIQHMKAGRI